MDIKLRLGDITQQSDIDVLANAANTHLVLGSGVAGAFARNAGREIEAEAMALGPIRLGEAVVTSAGRLANKYIVHAAAMGYNKADRDVPLRAGSGSSVEIISMATLNCLRLAEDRGCRSIAFPALATGVARFPVNECAQAMFEAIREYKRQRPETIIELVVFVLFTNRDFSVFSKQAKSSII